MIASNGSDGCEKEKKNYIEHRVTKMDTLAGIAIKYGVQVADVKRLNGLSTDLQMFALKTLFIPLPGSHLPPSPSLLRQNVVHRTLSRPCQYDNVEPLEPHKVKAPQVQYKISKSMSSLQKYYGLGSSNHRGTVEGTEMAVYRTGTLGNLIDQLPKASISGPLCNQKSGDSISNVLLPEIDAIIDGENEKSNEKSVRRRQKTDTDLRTGAAENLLKEENSVGSGDFSPVTSKGLTMRPKSASRTSLVPESESGQLNSIPVGLGDSIIVDGLSGYSKSSSKLNMEDDANGDLLVWPTSKWSLKPDLQALSTAINMPIFDGLPKPIAGRRSKAALD